jgi:hypothetical protein
MLDLVTKIINGTCTVPVRMGFLKPKTRMDTDTSIGDIFSTGISGFLTFWCPH